ncbi:7TM diverse intracellular signaling domain-containing protein [Pseudobacteriovorax antillogorgiicola]|uniref:histidine kinase n=1 Tax=Pseudobacteriovorax antillogorgiicola TaxID=1513793 RepID=A0A1Y6BXD9_9BACT|nr:7TM diverse intracellular signaling domain-containing protein [Pseudobacteriovorax antillogorgiicola]TCS53075.1 Hpt domain-containing protein [Pseudobacteriovorax antillogorgiicola]SMF26168.1 Hpt domain-containing protein [Pseudobacteriovorax antillogorgiicola]
MKLRLLGFILGILLCPTRGKAESYRSCVTEHACVLPDSEQKALSLRGEWLFHWQKLLGPENESELLNTNLRWDPTQDWNTSDQFTTEGFATYVLVVESPRAQTTELWMDRVTSASRLWINGREVVRTGVVADNADDERGQRRIIAKSVYLDQGRNVFVLQISNFHRTVSNIRGEFLIGPGLVAESKRQGITDGLVFGSIFIMLFYHIYLWAIRKTRISPLYFAVFGFGIGGRLIVMGQGDLFASFVDVPIWLESKVEYLGFAVSSTGLLLFMNELYPKFFRRRYALAGSSLTASWAVLILLTPYAIYQPLLPFYQVLILLFGVLILAAMVRAVVHRVSGARTFTVGFAMLFLTAINDVMVAQGLLDSTHVIYFGMFFFIFFQSAAIASNFNEAFDRAEKAEKEVRGLNEGLEKLVQERTEEINKILSNVESGFLGIDRDFKILPGFTKACHELLPGSVFEGQNFLRCLNLDQRAEEHLEQSITQVFDDILPESVTVQQIPQRVGTESRSLSLVAAAIRDDQDQEIAAILFTINDATSLELVERQVKKNEMLITILQNLDSFESFLEDFWHEIDQARTACQAGNENQVRSLLHTMKGNLSMFGLLGVSQLIHRTEGRKRITLEQIDEIAQTVNSVLEDNEDVLGLKKRDKQLSEISQEEVDQLVSNLSQYIADAESLFQVRHRLDRLMDKPIGYYLGPIEQTVSDLGERLEKDVQFTLKGQGIKVPRHYSELLHNLIHLIRNAMDHGIEDADNRGSKDPVGKLSLEFSQQGDDLRIAIEDDGRGIDPERVKLKAIDKKVITEADAQSLSVEEIQNLIFHSGISTTEEANDISGRGVGMSAVKDIVESSGGQLKIESVVGKGTSFIITIPNLFAPPQYSQAS